MKTKLLICVLSLSATPAFSASGMSGILEGLLHPVLGFDHLLAMIAVGLLSMQLAGKHVLGLPAAFVISLMVGGIVGLLEMPLPEVEGVIAMSVLILGFAIATQAKLGVILAYPMVAIFAIFHGHAHGAEVPNLDNPASYVIGFTIASAVLHLIGVGIGSIAKTTRVRGLLGAGCAGIGLHMVLLTYGLI